MAGRAYLWSRSRMLAKSFWWRMALPIQRIKTKNGPVKCLFSSSVMPPFSYPPPSVYLVSPSLSKVRWITYRLVYCLHAQVFNQHSARCLATSSGLERRNKQVWTTWAILLTKWGKYFYPVSSQADPKWRVRRNRRKAAVSKMCWAFTKSQPKVPLKAEILSPGTAPPVSNEKGQMILASSFYHPATPSGLKGPCSPWSSELPASPGAISLHQTSLCLGPPVQQQPGEGCALSTTLSGKWGQAQGK